MTGRLYDSLFPEVRANIDGPMANDRYTTRATLDWCMRVLGVEGFDLDVAACVESHKAPRWYGWQALPGGPPDGDELLDGLTLPWDAQRIWVNPPYDNLEPWVVKAWETMFTAARRGDPFGDTMIGMLIPDNRREQPFWQRLVEPWRDGRFEISDNRTPHGKLIYDQISVAHDDGARLFTHSLPGRQAFGVPGNPEGIGQASPPFGVVLLEWRFEH